MERRKGSIKGIKVRGSVSLSHLLFTDDVMIFGVGSINEVKKFKDILDLYYKDIEVNVHKSSVLFNGLEGNVERHI
jgi:hypothetical protein